MSPLVLITELSAQGAFGAPQPSFQIDSQCNYSKADSFVSLCLILYLLCSASEFSSWTLWVILQHFTIITCLNMSGWQYLSIFFTADSSDLEECLIQSGHSTNVCKMNVLGFICPLLNGKLCLTSNQVVKWWEKTVDERKGIGNE